jgi:hypothetical protein
VATGEADAQAVLAILSPHGPLTRAVLRFTVDPQWQYRVGVHRLPVRICTRMGQGLCLMPWSGDGGVGGGGSWPRSTR